MKEKLYTQCVSLTLHVSNMGARVLTSVFCVCLLPSTFQERHGKVLEEKRVLSSDEKLEFSDTLHGSLSSKHVKIPSMDHQPYDLLVYNLDYSDGMNQYGEVKDAQTGSTDFHDTHGIVEEYPNGDFSSSENDKIKYSDTSDHEQFNTPTIVNLKGPRQLETIKTQTYHEEVEPYEISDFPRGQYHGHELEQAEVHYHQHEHLHRHNHEQNHLHKHRQGHKHKHEHAHESRSHHEHKHESQHEHNHQSQHNHNHKDNHGHGHHQEHKHSHRAWHKHGHTHHQEHKHDQHHSHNHEHHNSHKHSHRDGHRHSHHHGLKQEGESKHDRHHHGYHKKQHGQKDQHKHSHKRPNHKN